MDLDLSASLSPLLDQPSSPPEPLEDLQARLRGWRRRRRQVKAGLAAVTAVLVAAVVVVPLTQDQPNTVDAVDDRQDDRPDTSARDPFAPGIPTTVVTFEDVDGTVWKFDVYESTTELCMRKGTSGGGMCGPGSADPDWVMGFAMGDTQGVLNDVFGTVRNEVDRIEIRLDTGAVIQRSPQGQQMGFSVGFFAARIPAGTRVTMVVALDREGNELERIVPQPRLDRPEDRSTADVITTDAEQSRMFASEPLPVEITIDDFDVPLTFAVTDRGQVCISAVLPPANSTSCGEWDELGRSPGLFLEGETNAGQRYSVRLVPFSHPVVGETSAQGQKPIDVSTIDGSLRLVLIFTVR